MAASRGRKRPAGSVAGPSKKRKVEDTKDTRGKRTTSKAKGKEKAADRGFVPIPVHEDEEIELSDDDLQLLEEYGDAVSFLNRLDEKGITRSKKETERLHRLHKPERSNVKDDLPSINSDDEEDASEEWSSAVHSSDDEYGSSILDADTDADCEDDDSSLPTKPRGKKKKAESDDEEMPYESAPRRPRTSWESDPEEEEAVERLPIKLADGRIQKSGSKVYLAREDDESADESEQHETEIPQERSRIEDVSTGARFGRPAVVDVIMTRSRKLRVQAAKEQIAGVCQEILADPENSLGLLRRLNTFSLPEVSTPSHPEPVPNDLIIRKITFLSQLAVFKDIIPGYRIRALTDKEKAEKVSQMVQRTRDWEQGLVSVYQAYLRSLESEVTAKSELAEVALQCMCSLLVEVTHFNFRVNLMTAVVSTLSRKSWDKTSDLCLNTLVTVFRADQTGAPSLEVVRLLNRMIKERKFNVHPDVLSCLVHLRLKTELGVRASETKVDKPEGKTYAKGRAAARRAKGKATDQPHLSKKAKKTLKERKEIEKEMHEAAAEVDKEERASNQTETLKLLFVLYFRVLKNPHPTALLPAALRGISKFSHLVNVDFFKDLILVLKALTSRESARAGDADADAGAGADASPAAAGPTHARDVEHQLLCIATAFELLSGQGEALDIDLGDFVNRLYALLPALAVMPDIEAAPASARAGAAGAAAPLKPAGAGTGTSATPQTVSDLLFRALHLVFTRHTAAGAAAPHWRSAAFAKRLLTASLQWPPDTATRALALVGELVERDPALEALLSTDDRSVDGVYRPDLDDPQLCSPFGTSFWELRVLARRHWDGRVAAAARKLMAFSSSSQK